ncbi:MAG: sirohydrochlorin chelatase [Actinomycetes bacterium]
MTAPLPLVLAWHGTRNPEGRALIERTTRRVAEALPGVAVHIAWVDVEEHLLPATLAEVGSCVVVPCFLAAGYHVTQDVPEAVASVPYDVRVAPHLGGAFTGVLLQRVAEAGGPGDAIVLAAVGSLRETAQAEVAEVAERLTRELGVGVRIANLFGEPSVASLVTQARADGCRDVLVLPYTLAPGLWGDRIGALGVRVACPLGDHPEVTAAIAVRYRMIAPSR